MTILSGTISTPTTSADMKPLVEVSTRQDQPLIPVRSVRGQFGQLNFEDAHESSNQLAKSDGEVGSRDKHGESSFAGSLQKHAALWKNLVLFWISKLINTIFQKIKL